MSVRVRFAPSPTGMLHVGALRTVVFDDLFARKKKGKNVLRIEDTDRSRYDPASESEFIETLAWVGIAFDEGPHVGGPFEPYHQSKRKEAGMYARWIETLLAAGHAYRAFETPEELDEMRLYQQVNKQPTGYFGGAWREASDAKIAEALASGKPFVIRQRMPKGRSIVVEDAVRGRIVFDSDSLPDPVLIKADGMPTYHFAAVVDDHLMEISHVLRGEEWIPSSPYHRCLYEQFGWEPPVFVHCPVIVGLDGKKLSKRHGATSVLDYASEGFLPQPLRNFVALIGWSPGNDREIMTDEEMVEAFDLSGIQPSPGKFDIEKLRWMNGSAIRDLSPPSFWQLTNSYLNNPNTVPYWESQVEREQTGDQPKPKISALEVLRGLKLLNEELSTDASYAHKVMNLSQGRIETLGEIGHATAFFFEDQPMIDPAAKQKWLLQNHVPAMFESFIKALPSCENSAEGYEKLLRGHQDAAGFEKLGPIVHPTRVALTGRTVGPGLFELMEVLGADRIERRLTAALESIKSAGAESVV